MNVGKVSVRSQAIFDALRKTCAAAARLRALPPARLPRLRPARWRPSLRARVPFCRAARRTPSRLRRRMPCEWLEKDGEYWILILNEIFLPPPYSPDLCKGTPGPTLHRVQKVLAGELEKLVRA